MPEKWKQSLDCQTPGWGSRGCNKRTGYDIPGADLAAFGPHAVLINLGQNDYGKPAHTDPKTGKPVKSHLPVGFARIVAFDTDAPSLSVNLV